jgi:hypothetical protein
MLGYSEIEAWVQNQGFSQVLYDEFGDNANGGQLI